MGFLNMYRTVGLRILGLLISAYEIGNYFAKLPKLKKVRMKSNDINLWNRLVLI